MIEMLGLIFLLLVLIGAFIIMPALPSIITFLAHSEEYTKQEATDSKLQRTQKDVIKFVVYFVAAISFLSLLAMTIFYFLLP